MIVWIDPKSKFCSVDVSKTASLRISTDLRSIYRMDDDYGPNVGNEIWQPTINVDVERSETIRRKDPLKRSVAMRYDQQQSTWMQQ
jgi:hypothetical protein